MTWDWFTKSSGTTVLAWPRYRPADLHASTMPAINVNDSALLHSSFTALSTTTCPAFYHWDYSLDRSTMSWPMVHGLLLTFQLPLTDAKTGHTNIRFSVKLSPAAMHKSMLLLKIIQTRSIIRRSNPPFSERGWPTQFDSYKGHNVWSGNQQLE